MLQNEEQRGETGTRRKGRLNRQANALFLKIAGGRLRAYSGLKHRGRRSGREYTTPVSAYPFGDGFVVALLYGEAQKVDWVQNVMAAGQCLLQTGGKEYRLERPEIVPASQAERAFPPLLRWLNRSRGIREFLWVHRRES